MHVSVSPLHIVLSHLYYLPSLLHSFTVWVASKAEWLEGKRECSQTRLNKLIKSVFYNTPCLFICVPPEQLKLHTPKTRLNFWSSLFRGARCASAWRGVLMSPTRGDVSRDLAREVNRSAKSAVKYLPHKAYSILMNLLTLYWLFLSFHF